MGNSIQPPNNCWNILTYSNLNVNGRSNPAIFLILGRLNEYLPYSQGKPICNINKLKDTNLSWKAKGLLAYLLSLPDDWQIYESEIVKHAKDGIDSTRTAIKELIDAGYIERQRVRDEKGRLSTVYESPIHIGFSKVFPR